MHNDVGYLNSNIIRYSHFDYNRRGIVADFPFLQVNYSVKNISIVHLQVLENSVHKRFFFKIKSLLNTNFNCKESGTT